MGTLPPDDDYKCVRPSVHGPRLAASTGVADWGDTHSREADGNSGIANHGAGPRTALQERSSGAQLGTVVRIGDQPPVADSFGQGLAAAGAASDGTGRHHCAALGT